MVSLSTPGSSGPASSDFPHALFQHPISTVTSPGHYIHVSPVLRNTKADTTLSVWSHGCQIGKNHLLQLSPSHWYTLTHTDSHFLQKGYIAGLHSTSCPFLHSCFLDSCLPDSRSAWGYLSLHCRTLHSPLLNSVMFLTFGIRPF